MANNDKANPFYGKQNNSVRCSFPGCSHVGSFISKVHCRNVHGIEREEVGRLYGYPESIGKGWAMMNDRSL